MAATVTAQRNERQVRPTGLGRWNAALNDRDELVTERTVWITLVGNVNSTERGLCLTRQEFSNDRPVHNVVGP